MDTNSLSNKNFGAGGQENSQQIGGSHNVQYNADTINYHGERVQEPTRTSPPPSSTVPFHRDPNFVDRPELETLEEKLSIWNKKVALVGIGGVGKSQLAIEFCYRICDKSPEIWTFWVHAGSAARFDADIRKLACDAGIPGWNDPKSDAFALVYSWLRDERNGKWILVLDNVDDASFLFEKPDGNDESARIRIAYLPPCAHGSALITSRSRMAAASLADECDTIVVNHMGQAMALALLEKKLGQRYLVQLEESEKSQTSLLSSASKEFRRDEEAQNSIILTLQISFQHVLRERPSAADLLSLMSMYNYQGIPEYLLKAGRSGTDKDFDEDIVTLEEVLLINITMSSTTYFEMHRLVQVAARAWLRSQGSCHEWAQRAGRQLDEAVSDDRPETWGRCEELYPHVVSTLNLQGGESSLQPVLTHMRALGLAWSKPTWINWVRGLSFQFELLIALLEFQLDCEAMTQALKGSKKELGEDRRKRLTSADNLATELNAQERYLASDLDDLGKYEAKKEAAQRMFMASR
ncbi:hypothetical protein KC351_g12240 [Hortaea werneckii]|nr:hypothetical protein KC351_g12240 [Hortaea werneckii]